MKPLYFVIPTLAVLVCLFALGALVTIFVRLPYLAVTGQFTKASRIVVSMDRLCAAGLPWGWDGTHTISWECGGTDCTFCKFICALLSRTLQARHCEEERAA